MRVRVHHDIADIPRDEWNRLAGDTYPFLTHEFLGMAEASGSVSEENGWLPCHLVAYDDKGAACGALPLYEKQHSWGEFVFDWAWANAYERAGLSYYPKLIAATPYTPASCHRFLVEASDTADTKQALLQRAIELVDERQCSSLHLQFAAANEVALLQDANLAIRKDCQFHWQNKGYQDFNDFLGEFSARKRKKAKRDRSHVRDAGITFRQLRGDELTESDWNTVYGLISLTFLQRGSLPYFNLDFFVGISELLPDNILVIIGEQAGEAVAAAIFFVGKETLYGRYWGCNRYVNALHFETCYYQGIEYCIEHKLKHFEPGTQGEHKISRGFLPVETRSAHWLSQPEFLAAIANYVDEESHHIDRYMDAVNRHSPYRRRKDQEK